MGPETLTNEQPLSFPTTPEGVSLVEILSPDSPAWPKNVNLVKPPWLQYLIIGMSVLNLTIVGFTVIFQTRNPKSM
jgi:hypothetical protein